MIEGGDMMQHKILAEFLFFSIVVMIVFLAFMIVSVFVLVMHLKIVQVYVMVMHL